MSGLKMCSKLTGQCTCKRHASERKCMTCQDGFYGLKEVNLFGCKGERFHRDPSGCHSYLIFLSLKILSAVSVIGWNAAIFFIKGSFLWLLNMFSSMLLFLRYFDPVMSTALCLHSSKVSKNNQGLCLLTENLFDWKFSTTVLKKNRKLKIEIPGLIYIIKHICNLVAFIQWEITLTAVSFFTIAFSLFKSSIYFVMFLWESFSVKCSRLIHFSEFWDFTPIFLFYPFWNCPLFWRFPRL